tara:strand:+ start:38673 stop:39017 length:345 start_codon:yes stop_codon:yes gene_type:complete
MKTTDQIKRTKRLDKKLYVGKFAVYGFEVSFKFADVTEEGFDRFFSDLVSFVDSRDLIMGGAGGTERFSIYISNYGRYLSATEQDREAFIQWLACYDFITDCSVEALSDAYYGV